MHVCIIIHHSGDSCGPVMAEGTLLLLQAAAAARHEEDEEEISDL